MNARSRSSVSGQPARATRSRRSSPSLVSSQLTPSEKTTSFTGSLRTKTPGSIILFSWLSRTPSMLLTLPRWLLWEEKQRSPTSLSKSTEKL